MFWKILALWILGLLVETGLIIGAVMWYDKLVDDDTVAYLPWLMSGVAVIAGLAIMAILIYATVIVSSGIPSGAKWR